MNDNKLNKTEQQKKEPCFKCVVRNLPGGRMKGLFSPCDDCVKLRKKQEKERREKIIIERA